AAIRSFIAAFLRPLGDRPVAPALAAMLAERAADGPAVGGGLVEGGLQTARQTARQSAVAPTGSEATVPLGRPDGAARLRVSAATQRITRHGVATLPRALDAWLASDVSPGDVHYDIGAGVGACSL